MDYDSFVEEIIDISRDTLLNRQQKATFIRTTLSTFMLQCSYAELEAIKAAIRAPMHA